MEKSEVEICGDVLDTYPSYTCVAEWGHELGLHDYVQSCDLVPCSPFDQQSPHHLITIETKIC